MVTDEPDSKSHLDEFNKELSACYIPGVILDSEDLKVNKNK